MPCRAVQRMGQDSRVRVTKQVVAGEVQRVWRWLARPTPLSTPTAHPPVHNHNHNHNNPTVPDLDS
jgi:hypothetical protein